MSAVCEICGKGPTHGNNVARAGRAAQKRRVRGRSRRLFRPNVQRARIVVDGTPKRINVCTACLKAGKVDGWA